MTADSPSIPDTPRPLDSHGWRWAPAWVLTFVALWPAPGYAEGVMVLGALAAIVRLLLGRFARFFQPLAVAPQLCPDCLV